MEEYDHTERDEEDYEVDTEFYPSFLETPNFNENAYIKKKIKKINEEDETTYLLPIKKKDGAMVVPTVPTKDNMSQKYIEKLEKIEREKQKKKDDKIGDTKRKREDEDESKKRPKKDMSKPAQIAAYSTAILEDPVLNVSKFEKILEFLQDNDVMVEKLTIVSLMALYLDLIPDYRINPDPNSQGIKHKKFVEETYNFEKTLLSGYQKFLQHCFLKKDNVKLNLICVKTLCTLLQEKPHFNFSYNIIKTLVPYLNRIHSKVSGFVFDAFTKIFQNDKTESQASRDIVEDVCEFIFNRKYNVDEKVTNIFLFLKLSTQLETEHDDFTQKNQAAILNAIILSYMRLLKTNHNSPLLFSILSGLSKFSHLINVELLHDLMTYMKIIMEMGNLPLATFLQTLITSSKLRLGIGMALNLDFGDYYTQLYTIIPKVMKSENERDHRLLIDALFIMLVKFKIPKLRCAAFVKRILTYSLQSPFHVSVAMVHLARYLMNKYPAVKNEMMTGDEAGIGEYQPFIDQPDHANPFSTNFWELGTLSTYFGMKPILNGDIKELTAEEYQEILTSFEEIDFQKNFNVKKGHNKFKSEFYKEALTKLLKE